MTFFFMPSKGLKHKIPTFAPSGIIKGILKVDELESNEWIFEKFDLETNIVELLNSGTGHKIELSLFRPDGQQAYFFRNQKLGVLLHEDRSLEVEISYNGLSHLANKYEAAVFGDFDLSSSELKEKNAMLQFAMNSRGPGELVCVLSISGDHCVIPNDAQLDYSGVWRNQQNFVLPGSDIAGVSIIADN